MASLPVLLAASCATGQQASSAPHQVPDLVRWNGNKIVSRILPEPDFNSLFLRLPIAHAAAKGQGVRVAVISRGGSAPTSTIVKRTAPKCVVEHYEPARDEGHATELGERVVGDGCRVAVIPGITSWTGETAVAFVRKLIAEGVTVLLPSDLSEDKATIDIMNKLHAIGAITVGRVNRQSTVMKDSESETENAPLNRRIRDIQTDLFSTMGFGPAHGEAVAVATTAGVAALVLEKWPTLGPREVRERIMKGARHVWQATSIETGRWSGRAFTVHPITARYTPTDEKAIFRFRVLDAPGCLDVDTEIPWFLNMLNCQKAWGITKGQGAVVVVSDQGFHLQHPELVDRIETTAEFGPASLSAYRQNFHGTDMSRIVLAVAPEAKIMPVLCSAKPSEDRKEYVASLAENIAKSFQFAADKKADAISASWMFSLNSDTDLLAAIRGAVDRGVTVSWFHYPRRSPGVLRSSFTYRPASRDKEAIGFADRFLTDPPGFRPVEIEAGLSGTAPQAAGLVALVRSVNSKLTPQEIEALIFENSTPIGRGILIPDAYEIVMAASRKKADSTP